MRPSSRAAMIVLCLVLIAIAAIGVDALRLGFFSDDWLLLDGARRAPLVEQLLGQHGVWPWYRPLSRELYFFVIVMAGSLGRIVARALSLAAVVTSAFALFRIAPRLFGGRGGAVAAVLFLTFAFTKFLAVWASGFQDLLATAFVLGALVAFDRGRTRLALALAGAAMFSKETGFLVVPLLVAWQLLVAPRRPRGRFVVGLAALTAGAIAVHVAVRATWPSTMALRPSEPGRALWARLAEFAGGFWMPGLPPDALAAGLGIVAAGAAVVLLLLEAQSPERAHASPAANPPARRGVCFAAAALFVGAVPAMLAYVGRLTTPLPWHVYPAAPAACLLVAAAVARTPRIAQRVIVAVFVAAGVWGQAFVEPTLASLLAGAHPARGWYDQVRVDARTRRLAADLRSLLADRPESLVVLYEQLPYGTFLQTQDGPATREILGDPTIRTYFLGDAPRGLRPDRLRILIGDPETMHLLPFPSGPDELETAAMSNLLRGEPRPARALLACARARGPLLASDAYLDALAAQLDQGPLAMLDALERAGLGDSSDAAAGRSADSIGGTADAGVGRGFHDVLRRPTSSSAHLALGETLLARTADIPAAIEFEVAASLAPDWATPSLRLGALYASHGRWAQARAAFASAARASRPPGMPSRARQALDELAADSARAGRGGGDDAGPR